MLQYHSTLTMKQSKLRKIACGLLGLATLWMAILFISKTCYYLHHMFRSELQGPAEYRLLHLKNGIDVLLVDSTNTETTFATCSLSVGVGTFSDQFQGLSNLAGQLVLSQQNFSRFIKDLRGTTNVTTHSEETIFYFKVYHAKIDETVKRFAALFTNITTPKKDYQPIRTETTPKILLWKSLGSEGHPSRLMEWNNLTDIDYVEVDKFIRRHYAAQRMKIYLQAKKPLDELQTLAESFLRIRNNTELVDDFSAFTADDAFNPKFRDVYFKQGTDNTIEFTWTLPTLFDKYKSNPDQLAIEAIVQESDFFVERLKKSVPEVINVAARTVESNSVFALFRILIGVSAHGVAKISNILGMVAHLLKTLHANNSRFEEYFNDMSKFEKSLFENKKGKLVLNDAIETVTKMQHYKAEDILKFHPYTEYNETHLLSTFQLFTTRTFNLIVTTVEPYEGISYNHTEMAGVNFGVMDFPEVWEDVWEAANSTSLLTNETTTMSP